MRIPTLLFFALLIGLPARAANELSDEEIRTILVEQSMAAYAGPCPCPHNVMQW